MKTNRKDRTRIPKYEQTDEYLNENIEKGGLGKNIFLLVEGETEVVYFEKLKQNIWLKNSLAGIVVEKVGDLGASLKYLENVTDKSKVYWIVADNDKQNAFVLEEKNHPFFEKLTDEQLPENICGKLKAAYNQDWHNYFLSIHDYLQCLKLTLGAHTTIEYWDRIQFFTPPKSRLLEKFDKTHIKNPHYNVKLAYSCIAFEFWLILHFEQNRIPFLWVDKEKQAEIDVVTYLKILRPYYEKGIENPCNAYTCLYDNFNKEVQTVSDDWRVLTRIFTAYRNASWLRYEMQPILNQQSGKWYEVNPYILGLDMLMAELLNIKHLREDIDYFNLTIRFDFDIQNGYLTIQVGVNDGRGFEVDQQHQSNFVIKDEIGNSFMPSIKTPFEFPNSNAPVNFQYAIPQPINNLLVLVFNDPRPNSKSSQLFVLLN